MVNKDKDGKKYCWNKEQNSIKCQWVRHKPEYHGKMTSTSSSSVGRTNIPSEGDINKKLTLTKDFKAGFLDIKNQSDVQAFLSQFSLNSQGND